LASDVSGKLKFAGGNKCTNSCPEIKIYENHATLKILRANLGGAQCLADLTILIALFYVSSMTALSFLCQGTLRILSGAAIAECNWI